MAIMDFFFFAGAKMEMSSYPSCLTAHPSFSFQCFPALWVEQWFHQ